MLDSQRWSYKPKDQMGLIVKRAKITDITLEELADDLVHGASFRPGILIGGKGAANWKRQQVFALDIEHSHTIEEAYKKSISLGLIPCFMYTSFSHTDEDHRFRMVYCADRVIFDGEVRDKLQLALMNAIGGCDTHCTDRNRVFFGGGSGTVLYPNYGARINADEVIREHYRIPDPQVPKVRVSQSTPRTFGLKVEDTNVPLIAKLDVEGMRAAISKHYMLCTHQDRKHNIWCSEVLVNTINKDITFFEDNIFINSIVKNPAEIHHFNSRAELYGFIDSIDMTTYLGVPEGMFNCILPGHEDATPSAHIYTTDTGVQVYKCFGCNEVRTIITITEQLAQCTRKQAFDFLKAVYRVDYQQSEWVTAQREEIDRAIEYLQSDSFCSAYPNIHRVLGYRKKDLLLILNYIKPLINDAMQYNGRPIFSLDIARMMRICQTKDRTKMESSVNMFALLGMLDKLTLNHIPEEPLKRAVDLRKQRKHAKLITFYCVPDYDFMALTERELQAGRLIADGFTLKGMSREYVLRTFGTDEANRVYPQYHRENAGGTSKDSDDRTLALTGMIADAIGENGYILESRLNTRDLMGTQWKR